MINRVNVLLYVSNIMTHCFNSNLLYQFLFFSLQRPPSQSLNSYGHSVHDDVRSPTGSTGTPGPLSQQPSSQQSTDNNSEAGKSSLRCFSFPFFITFTHAAADRDDEL